MGRVRQEHTNDGRCPPNPDGGPAFNNNAGNGYTANDEWGPAIAFIKNNNTTNRELVLTWYDTQGDSNNTNVNIWGLYDAESSINMSDFFSNLIPVGAGAGTPWNHSLAAWFDYQALTPEPLTYTLLGSWGGDARLCTSAPCNDAGIFSTIIK